MSYRNEFGQHSVRATGGEDAVDQVLRGFFRAALPTPWPAWKAPATRVTAAPRSRRSLFWSRFALAASVALLLGSQLWLAGFYRPPEAAEAGGRSHQPVDVAAKPHVSSPDGASEAAGGRMPSRPVLKNMR